MDNKRDFGTVAGRYVFITVLFFVLAILLCCFASVFSSFGYKQSLRASAFSTLGATDKERVKIVIDAGHGGADAGASANGLSEKDLNLSIALKLASFLSLSDVDVVLTREDDRMLGEPTGKGGKKAADLSYRVQVANSTENCIFVSIHMNKFPLEYCRGTQVFWGPGNEKSMILAQYIQSSAVRADSTNKREIKKATSAIYVLTHIDCPAVLVECGFLSNPTDAALLSTEAGQARMAFTIFSGLSEYLEEQTEQ